METYTMTEKYLVGIIQVPLSAFLEEVVVGRHEDPKIARRLEGIFKREGCESEKASNHIRGLVDFPTIKTILSALGFSYRKLQDTVWRGKYPKACIRGGILCIDGKQRICAARKLFGEHSWWTVRLYCVSKGRRTIFTRYLWDVSLTTEQITVTL